MATKKGIQVKFDPQRNHSNFQANFVGATTDSGERGWWPAVQEITKAGGAGTFSTGSVVKFGSKIIIAGDFDKVGIDSRDRLGAVSIDNGAVSPLFSSTTFGGSAPLCCGTDGTFIYVGGTFTQVNGLTQIDGKNIGGLVRFDGLGNLDLTWNPGPITGGLVCGFAQNTNNNEIMVVGDFTSVDGTTRNRGASISTSVPASLGAWNPDINDEVFGIEYDADRDFVYLVGAFTTLKAGGSLRNRIARINTIGAGVVDAWDPDSDGPVNVILLDESIFYIGGNFGNVAGVVRNNMAAIDELGDALPWDPDVNAACNGLAKVGRTVIGTGDFILVDGGGSVRSRLAAWDQSPTATLDEWDPNANGDVEDLFVLGKTIYAVGSFVNIEGNAQKGFHRIHYPLFTDANTRHVKLTGSDAGTGTLADPFRTIEKAAGVLGAAFRYVLTLDNGPYEENQIITDLVIPTGNAEAGIFAVAGTAPVWRLARGVDKTKLGARTSGRTKFSLGAFPSTFYFVDDVLGNDGTGVRGDETLPFASISAALGDGGRIGNDTVQVQNSNSYASTLNAAALSVTIQAKDGEVPNLKNSIITGNSGTSIKVYGMTFNPDILTLGFRIDLDGDLEVFDCTFLGGFSGIEIKSSGVNRNVKIENNAFVSMAGSPIHMKSTLTTIDIINCSFSDSGSRDPLNFDIRYGAGNSEIPFLLVDRCSFLRNTGGGNVTYTSTVNSSVVGQLTIRNSEFEDDSDSLNEGIGITWRPGQGNSIGTQIVNCFFKNLGGIAVSAETQGLGGPTFLLENSVIRNCGRTASGAPGLDLDSEQALLKVENTLVVDSTNVGYKLKANISGTLNAKGCVVINSGAEGFALSDNQPVTLRECVEARSVGLGITGGLGGGSLVTNCIFQTGVDPNINQSSNVFVEDPLFLNVEDDQENAGFSARSRAILNSVTNKPLGLSYFMLVIEDGVNESFIINGFNIEGDVNFANGIQIFQETAIEQCTFKGLGPVAIQSGFSFDPQKSKLRRNSFSTNGIAILSNSPEGTVERNQGVNCEGAFLVNTSYGLTARHNTAFGCEYGQFDRPGLNPRLLEANLYSGNGTLDYDGPHEQKDSLIETVSPDAILTRGTQLNPLFRDISEIDLRLQTVETGFVFDSPAKGLASDGSDAGAFDFSYGLLDLTFTLVDFEADKGGGVIYRNPTHLVRRSSALKLSEGETHGGLTYSTASVFKREHLLTWEPNTDMPSAQVVDLEAIYTTGDGECQLSLDGGITFIPVRVIRSAEFRFTELEDTAYSDDSLPTPVAELVFRDSL